MFTNGNFNYAGAGYNQVQQPKVQSVYTQEEYNTLVKQENSFSLGITKDEYLRSYCNHRKLDGSDSLVIDPLTGIASCTVCGYKFKPCDDISIDEIQNEVNNVLDILQTIKIMYIDMPVDTAKEYFQIIPLIEKIPKLFDLAAKDMAKHDNNPWNYNTQSMGAMSVLNNIRGMFNNGYVPTATIDPNQANNPYGTMAQNGNPLYNGFGYPGANQQMQMGGAPGVGGFNPAGGYQPNPGYAFTPNPNAATVPTGTTTTPGAQAGVVSNNTTANVTVPGGTTPQAKEPVKEETVTQKINL